MLHRRDLQRTALLQPDPHLGRGEGWMLSGDPADMTLEDVFRAVMVEPGDDERPPFLLAVSDATQRDIELFVSQATMHVNNAIAKHLRKFP